MSLACLLCSHQGGGLSAGAFCERKNPPSALPGNEESVDKPHKAVLPTTPSAAAYSAAGHLVSPRRPEGVFRLVTEQLCGKLRVVQSLDLRPLCKLAAPAARRSSLHAPWPLNSHQWGRSPKFLYTASSRHAWLSSH